MGTDSVKRLLWRGAVDPARLDALVDAACAARERVEGLIEEGLLLTFGLYHWERYVFLYYETLGGDLAPEFVMGGIGDCLENWPGGEGLRKWIPLIDVFHFNEPEGLEHWRRKSPVERRLGQIGFLKPETMQHYLFFHYALQEERSFGGDKYEIIGLSENILFAYRERPEVIEAPTRSPRLCSKVVPSNWDEVGIPSCFLPWPDLPGVYLRPMDELLTCFPRNLSPR